MWAAWGGGCSGAGCGAHPRGLTRRRGGRGAGRPGACVHAVLHDEAPGGGSGMGLGGVRPGRAGRANGGRLWSEAGTRPRRGRGFHFTPVLLLTI